MADDTSYWSGDDLAGLVVLAALDESEPYEVDFTEVYWKPATGCFIVRRASGCSCWEGDYDDIELATFDQLKADLLGPNDYKYNPSLLGAKYLIERVQSKLDQCVAPSPTTEPRGEGER